MPTRRFVRSVRPYITVFVVILVVALLVGAIYFTELGIQWITFLTGILIASILGMASRASRAEWIITRRTAQLTSLKDKLEQEAMVRQQLAAEHDKSLQLLHETERAFSRLIPQQLLKLLNRDILDVTLGDQVERKLTVLFTDIRNFTALSETMTPQENFNFLNSYLKHMEPIIGSHRGIIDKYVGDTIMALFTDGADDALAAAIHMLEKLDEYNLGRARAGYSTIQIGFGLNTGLVMIGTVGGINRMESTVIGDAVNLSSRIEEATKTYQVPLLISQNTVYDLAAPAKYDIRFLDRIRVKGKTQPLSIYEVFDTDPVRLRDGKRASKLKFEQAIAHYHMKNIPRAVELLKECLEIAPKDMPARIYLTRCERYQTTGQHYSTGEINVPLQWRMEYQMGIKEIDMAHAHLFTKVNEFITIAQTGNLKAVREIFSYLVSHHREGEDEEEELMQKYDYAFYQSHMQEHNRFIENLKALKEEADAPNCDLTSLSFRTQLLLFDWFTGHIAKSDRHAARFLLHSMEPSRNGSKVLV